MDFKQPNFKRLLEEREAAYSYIIERITKRVDFYNRSKYKHDSVFLDFDHSMGVYDLCNSQDSDQESYKCREDCYVFTYDEESDEYIKGQFLVEVYCIAKELESLVDGFEAVYGQGLTFSSSFHDTREAYGRENKDKEVKLRLKNFEGNIQI